MKPERLDPLYLGLIAGVGLTLLVVLVGDVRVGGFLLGGVLGLAALARGLAPEERIVGLAVRSRWLDVATYAVLAAAVIAIVGTVKLT